MANRHSHQGARLGQRAQDGQWRDMAKILALVEELPAHPTSHEPMQQRKSRTKPAGRNFRL
jgi:hypothetical protein